MRFLPNTQSTSETQEIREPYSMEIAVKSWFRPVSFLFLHLLFETKLSFTVCAASIWFFFSTLGNSETETSLSSGKCYLPNHACWSPCTSIARPKSASFTAAPLALLARSKFSGCKNTSHSTSASCWAGAVGECLKVDTQRLPQFGHFAGFHLKLLCCRTGRGRNYTAEGVREG